MHSWSSTSRWRSSPSFSPLHLRLVVLPPNSSPPPSLRARRSLRAVLARRPRAHEPLARPRGALRPSRQLKSATAAAPALDRPCDICAPTRPLEPVERPSSRAELVADRLRDLLGRRPAVPCRRRSAERAVARTRAQNARRAEEEEDAGGDDEEDEEEDELTLARAALVPVDGSEEEGEREENEGTRGGREIGREGQSSRPREVESRKSEPARRTSSPPSAPAPRPSPRCS